MKPFKKIDIKTVSDVQVYKYERESLVLIREEKESLTYVQAEAVLDETDTEVGLLIGNMSDRFLIRCLCRTNRIRALELIDFVFGQFGVAKGTAEWAQGSISEVLLDVCISESEATDVTGYFMMRTDEYFTECEIVEAETFAKEHPETVAGMKAYEKAKVSWAYVRTTDIVPEGVELSVRTLENDTGVLVTAAEDVYIMIGCRGEVYQIQKEKFETSYEVSDEKLDIFTQVFDFIPAVERTDDRTYIPIDEAANLCYPKKGAAVLALQLSKRTRVFAKNGTDYFVGDAGDYMAMRMEDKQDIYIIRQEVFRRTYTEKE